MTCFINGWWSVVGDRQLATGSQLPRPAIRNLQWQGSRDVLPIPGVKNQNREQLVSIIAPPAPMFFAQLLNVVVIKNPFAPDVTARQQFVEVPIQFVAHPTAQRH